MCESLFGNTKRIQDYYNRNEDTRPISISSYLKNMFQSYGKGLYKMSNQNYSLKIL